MPLYEYRCEACAQRIEVIQKLSDAPPEACRACGKGPLVRLLSSPAIQFKGSGWYITDYARKASGSGEKASSGEASSSKDGGAGASDSTSSKADGGSTEGKPSSAAPPAAAKTES